MKYLSRSKDQSIRGLPKVYYTAHPADHGLYLNTISAQLLKLENCAVFYDPDPEHPEDEDSFRFDIQTMQLIVIPVTCRFLHEDCRARREVFALAMEKHIPVLPILEEQGIGRDLDRICYEKELEIVERLAAEYGEPQYRRSLSVCYGRLGNCLERQDEPGEAQVLYEKSLAIQENIASTVTWRRGI